MKFKICAENVARALTSVVIVLIIAIFAKGYETFALGFLAFVAIMMMVWAVFDFCPSIWILSKFLPKCYCECDKDKKETYE
jgi:hypothetical protein